MEVGGVAERLGRITAPSYARSWLFRAPGRGRMCHAIALLTRCNLRSVYMPATRGNPSIVSIKRSHGSANQVRGCCTLAVMATLMNTFHNA